MKFGQKEIQLISEQITTVLAESHREIESAGCKEMSDSEAKVKRFKLGIGVTITPIGGVNEIETTLTFGTRRKVKIDGSVGAKQPELPFGQEA